jgi:hypothetical protein
MDKTPDKYRRQIADTWIELANSEALRKAADQRIEDCRELIKANANFLPDVERWTELMLLEIVKRPTNIAEAVRYTLFLAKARNQRLTPVQIKDNIEERGFRLADYTNPLASIHTVLRRMREADPPEVNYDEKTETFFAAGFPLRGMFAEEYYEKVRRNVMDKLARYDAAEIGAAASAEVDKLFDAMLERRQLTKG